jgi:AraC-like DNA-binding protein
VRPKAAAAMLSQGRTVTDVALCVGFENPSHFSKVFRAFLGVNPRDYARA